MSRHLGIRGKILAVLALPVLVLAVASGAVVLDARAEVDRAQQTRAVSTSAEQFGQLMVALQEERLASVRAVAGQADGRARLADLRTTTDVARVAVVRELAGWSLQDLPARARAAVGVLTGATDRLPSLRQSVDRGALEPATVTRSYADVVIAVATLPAAVADTLVDRRAAAGLAAVGWLGLATEALSREQLAGLWLLGLTSPGGSAPSAGLASHPAHASGVAGEPGVAGKPGVAGEPGVALIAELAAADAQRVEALDRFRLAAGSAQVAALNLALAPPHGAIPSVGTLAERLQQPTDAAAAGRGPIAVDAATWRRLTAAQADTLRRVSGSVAADSAAVSAQAVDEARLRVELTLAAAVLLVGLSVLMALIQSRRITAPLRRLTAVATGLAADLPALVERAQAGGAAPEGPAAVVVYPGEVGRLAEAFRDVHTTTLVVAHQQAMLRATVAEMFVNVARRNQVLLSRLLSFIDRLERREEDPDTLNNLFGLDHLATRMRRNAESLLVLAGADSGRRLRSAMPLADVLRTAVSEIEHYDRVRLALVADPPVIGHLALATAHLFAELIENATNFSDPGSPVTVASHPTASGVRVTITDEGIGLPPDELAQVNARLADGGAVDAMSTQRLGFFVVGRLAARLDAKVQLRRGDERGTVVTVELSPALFLPGSVPNAPKDGVEHVPVTDGSARSARGLTLTAHPRSRPLPQTEPVALLPLEPPEPAGPLEPLEPPEPAEPLKPLEPPEPAEPLKPLEPPEPPELGLYMHPGSATVEPVVDAAESWLPPNASTGPEVTAAGAERESAEEDHDLLSHPPGSGDVQPGPPVIEANGHALGIAEEPPAPDWKDLLHQRQPRVRQAPVADPLSPTVWLTDDAWADAPPPAAAGPLSGEGGQATPAPERVVPPSSSLPWQPEEEPVRAPIARAESGSVTGKGFADHAEVKPQLPHRTPTLPPTPGDGAVPAPSRRTPPSGVSGAASPLSDQAEAADEVASELIGDLRRTGCAARQSFAAALQAPPSGEPVAASAGAHSGPARPGTPPGPAAVEPAPAANALRDVLPQQGFRIGFRFGRRSRGSGAEPATGHGVASSGADNRVMPSRVSRRRPASSAPVGSSAGSGSDVGRPDAETSTVSGTAGVAWSHVPGSTSGAPDSGAPGSFVPGPGARSGLGAGEIQPAALGSGGLVPGGLGSGGVGAGAAAGGNPAQGGTFGTGGGFGVPGAVAPHQVGTPAGGSGGLPAPAADGIGEHLSGASSVAGFPATDTGEQRARHSDTDPVDEERMRHAIASEALTELSRLSSYSPDRVSPEPASRLVRRTPAATTAGAPVEPAAAEPVPSQLPTAPDAVAAVPSANVPFTATDSAAPAGRRRDADELRRMLSGLQEGVRRGRGTAVPAGTAVTAGTAGDGVLPPLPPGGDGTFTTPPRGTDASGTETSDAETSDAETSGTDASDTDASGTDASDIDASDTDEWRTTP